MHLRKGERLALGSDKRVASTEALLRHEKCARCVLWHHGARKSKLKSQQRRHDFASRNHAAENSAAVTAA
jgi:hypothetical protein